MDKHMTLTKIIKQHEGLRLFPYQCSAGKTTIGWGRNLSDCGISVPEANYLLNRDIKKAKHATEIIFPKLNSYSESRQIALIDMMFNLGMSRFRTFKKMIKAIKNDDWEEAARQAKDSLWYRQVKGRATDDISLMLGEI